MRWLACLRLLPAVERDIDPSFEAWQFRRHVHLHFGVFGLAAILGTATLIVDAAAEDSGTADVVWLMLVVSTLALRGAAHFCKPRHAWRRAFLVLFTLQLLVVTVVEVWVLANETISFTAWTSYLASYPTLTIAMAFFASSVAMPRPVAALCFATVLPSLWLLYESTSHLTCSASVADTVKAGVLLNGVIFWLLAVFLFLYLNAQSRTQHRTECAIRTSRDRAQIDVQILSHRVDQMSVPVQDSPVVLDGASNGLVVLNGAREGLPPPGPPGSIPPGPPSSRSRSRRASGGAGSSSSGGGGGSHLHAAGSTAGSGASRVLQAAALAAGSGPEESRLIEACLVAVTTPEWGAAREVLRPVLDDALTSVHGDAARDGYERCIRQLHTLMFIYHKLAPERSFGKLREVTTAMRSLASAALCETIFKELAAQFKFGVLQHVIDGKFSLPPDNDVVRALLDRFCWGSDGGEMHSFLCTSLRSVDKFRTAVAMAEARATAAPVDANEVMNDAVDLRMTILGAIQAATRKYRHAFLSEHMWMAYEVEVMKCADAALDAWVNRERGRWEDVPQRLEEADQPQQEPPLRQALPAVAAPSASAATPVGVPGDIESLSASTAALDLT